MEKIAGLDYVQLKLDKAGNRVGVGVPLFPPGVTDLIVVSHGWHMDAPESQALYKSLIGNLVNAAGSTWNGANRQVGVCGIFWPSDKFRDDLSLETVNVLGGHAASAGGDLDVEVLKVQAREIANFLEVSIPVANFEKMVLRARGGGGDADKLVDFLRVAVGSGEADAQTKLDHKDLMTLPGQVILGKLKTQVSPILSAVAPQPGGAATAVGLSQTTGQALGLFSGAVAGVAKLLNQFAYFELKKRAGTVGDSLGRQLDTVAGLDGVKLHLVGHSFGARLVTAATAAMQARKVQSLTLLQAAFSHNSFSPGIDYLPLFPNVVGGFRDVIVGARVRGPIAITHTWNDKAVGLAYPTASRVSVAIASAFSVSDHFGGTKDVFGGMGANGALGLATGEGSAATYDGQSSLILRSGHVSNLRCDFIADHNDVGRMGAARVVQAAMG